VLQAKNQYCPKVSVIVPVKNGAAYIQGLIDSLMDVDYEKDKLEVVVVDGNSTDNTRKIVSQYPVKLLLEERPGLNAARNTGIKHSSGEIIAFTDADCIVPKNWIRNIVNCFRNPEVGCVGGNVLRYYDNFLSYYADESILPVMRVFKKREMLNYVKPPEGFPAGCNMAIRRETLEKAGFFDERIRYGYDEDELAERICKAGYKMVLDPEVLVKHKHRPKLAELLKQHLNYGRGAGLMLRMGVKSIFSKWFRLCIMSFFAFGLIILLLAIHALLTGAVISEIVLLFLLLLPPFGLMTFYGYKTIKNKDKKYGRIFIYPFIDIARALAFIFGVIYQLFKKQ
jgi:cellulose synthase/poly-beta-1,6-N-acetylglucosamine synthase-like glycosyltransferase